MSPAQPATMTGGGDDQLWGSGCGAVAGCHCWVPLQGAIAGVDVVPLLGAILGCHCSVLWLGTFFLYIDDAKIVFCYLGSMLVYFFLICCWFNHGLIGILRILGWKRIPTKGYL